MMNVVKRDEKEKSQSGAFVSIDEETAEGLYAHEPSSNLSPEKLFDRRWAMTVLEEAMGRLQTEYERSGVKEIFAAVQPSLTGDDQGGFAELGAKLKRSEARSIEEASARPEKRTVVALPSLSGPWLVSVAVGARLSTTTVVE